MNYPRDTKALLTDRVKQRAAPQGGGKRNLTGVEVLEPEGLGEQGYQSLAGGRLGKGRGESEDTVECLAF